MDKILIVDDNLEFLDTLKEGLKNYSGQFEALFASGAKEAVIKLKREDISILVTDLKMPKIDGLALLAYMSSRYPHIPCIVMTGYGSPAIRKKIDAEDVFYYIEKPFDFNELAGVIIEGLDLRDELVSLKDISGISVIDFLQLIEMEKKTCLLQVHLNGNVKGHFYFNEGVLYDAAYDSFKGESAALEMLGWNKVKFQFKRLPKNGIRRQIKTDLMSLILEAMRHMGEKIEDDSKTREEINDFSPEVCAEIENTISNALKA